MKFRSQPRYSRVTQTSVPQGLAVTPSDVAKLSEKGLSVSSNTAGLTFEEGSSDPVLSAENFRGVDAADIWNASRDAAERLTDAHKKDKSYYGD